jgi:hypothetical protein
MKCKQSNAPGDRWGYSKEGMTNRLEFHMHMA